MTDDNSASATASLSQDHDSLEDADYYCSPSTIDAVFASPSPVPDSPSSSFSILSNGESAPDTTDIEEQHSGCQHARKSRHSSSSSGSISSISKTKAKRSLSKRASGPSQPDSGDEESPKLRTVTCRQPSRRHTSDVAANGIRSARVSHNQVEKKYRNRLKGQFERLLSALPAEMTMGDSSDTTKALSKAEVLDLARRQICAMSAENDALKAQLEELRTRNFGSPVTPLRVSPWTATR